LAVPFHVLSVVEMLNALTFVLTIPEKLFRTVTEPICSARTSVKAPALPSTRRLPIALT